VTEKQAFPTETSLKLEVAEYCKRYCIEPSFPISQHWNVELGYQENRPFPDIGAAGCYAFYADDGELLYIGKAWQMGRRLGSYFQGVRSLNPGAPISEHTWTKPPKSIQTVGVYEPFEASSLEEYLIQKLRPSNNALVGGQASPQSRLPDVF
jgi:hypothetical protein